MLNCSKKCITTDLFQLALILTLLHNSNVFYPEDPQLDLLDGTLNGTQFPDVGNEISPDGIFGSTYYSRTSAYHQIPEWNRTPPHLSAKQLEDPPASSIINETNQYILGDDHAYYRERIIEELRRLSVQRYSELPRETAKGSLAFRNITAYLFDNTHENQSTDFTVTVPEFPSSVPTFEPAPPQPTFLPAPPVQDVEHTLDAFVGSPSDDLDLQLLQEMEEISANFKDGFPLQELFSQNHRQEDLSFLAELQNHLNEESINNEEAAAQTQRREPEPEERVEPEPGSTEEPNTNLTLTSDSTTVSLQLKH